MHVSRQRTVQSLWKLGWKSQSWRARNQQGLLVAAGNFPLEFSMEEPQLDPGSATRNLPVILLTSITIKLPTIISTWAA